MPIRLVFPSLCSGSVHPELAVCLKAEDSCAHTSVVEFKTGTPFRPNHGSTENVTRPGRSLWGARRDRLQQISETHLPLEKFRKLCHVLRSLILNVAILLPLVSSIVQGSGASLWAQETPSTCQASSTNNEPEATASPPLALKPKARAARTADERLRHIQQLREVYQLPSSNWPAPFVDAGVKWRELGMIEAPPASALAPTSPAKIQLGRVLFFDPRLSRTKEMACASCHDPDLGWADGRMSAFGLGRTVLARNTPSILNASLQPALFWDSRARNLEDQARQVLLNPKEMGATEADLITTLGNISEYRVLFQEAFGSESVSLDRVSQAIAAFETTLLGGRSAFDRFMNGQSQALSDAALVGLDLFRREARCINCHHGPTFSDGQLHGLNISHYGNKREDLGRYNVTGVAQDSGLFRTPSLRNVTATGPYMHSGLFELDELLTLYNAGMPRTPHANDNSKTPRSSQYSGTRPLPVKSPLLKPLGLNSQDLDDLTSFLEALAEPRIRIRPPELPASDSQRELTNPKAASRPADESS